MKRIFGFLSLVSLFVALGAQAEPGYISCTNGSIDRVGDSHIRINFLEDGVEISPYESSFTLDATDLNHNKGTYSIINKVVKISSEGEESKSTVNALLILNERRGTLKAAISYNKGAFRSYELTCKKVN